MEYKKKYSSLTFLFYSAGTFFVLLLLVLCSVTGCGRKGPPQAPKEVELIKITNISGEAREGEVELYWEIPKKKDKSAPLPGIKEFKIYRLPPNKEKVEGVSIAEAFNVIGSIEVKEIQDLSREIEYTDHNGFTREKWYHYVVAGFGREEQLIAISDTVDVYFSFEPGPPKNLRAEVKENYILLQWELPVLDIEGKPLKNLVGYNIYRKKIDQKAYMAINKILIKKERYVDMDLEKDVAYSYFIRAVDNHYPPWHESADSNIVEIENKNLVPPQAPRSLEAVGGMGKVSLSWERNVEPDLLGYRVYRSKTSGKDYELLNKELIREEYFDDTSAAKGLKYYYVVSAISSAKYSNESSFSNEESGMAQ